MKAINLVPLLFMTMWGGELYYYQSGKKVFIDELKTKRDGKIVTFKRNNRDVSILNYILLKPKDENCLKQIESMQELSFVEKIGDIYKFEVNSSISALEISAKLYEENLTIFSHPDFIQKREKRGTLTESSFLTSYAWYIKAINADKAWNYSKGDGIKVAIFDDGVDYKHPDLDDNYISGYDVDNYDSNVYPDDSKNDYHGTAVTGLIVAEENSVGVIGVAPRSYFYGIKQLYDSTSDTIKGFNWAKNKNVDVINCSWGSYDVSDSVKDTIVNLATKGRDGKGIVIVFAMGNDNMSMDKSGINDESEIEEVIGVGATDHLNQRSSFSNYGNALDIMAPGGYFASSSRASDIGVSSTDISGQSGATTDDYILSTAGELIGTSFSSPIVAGVVADMLSVNPSLTLQEVKDILYSTAQKVGTLGYKSKNNYTFNEVYGYGLVNANDAVKRAYDSDFKTSILTGWNLLGNVNESELSTNELFNDFAEIIYTYNGDWQLNPSSIGVGDGFWLKSTKTTTYTYSNTNVIQSPTTSKNWQLFSATKNLRLSDNNLYYVYRSDGWHNYPNGDLSVIYKGEGYWTRIN